MNKNQIKFVRGDTYTLSRYFTDKDGNILTFNSDTDQINFTVRKSINSDAVITKTITDFSVDEESKYSLNLLATDTQDLDFGYYGYDIEVRVGSDFVKTVESGILILEDYDFSRPSE